MAVQVWWSLLTDVGACFNGRRVGAAVAVAQLGEEVLVSDGVADSVPPPFAADDLPPASHEADVDPDVAMETHVRGHQWLDGDELRARVGGAVVAEGVVDVADDGGVALPANRSRHHR